MRLMVLGVGKFSIDCLKIITKIPEANLVLVVTKSDEASLGMNVVDFCSKFNIPVVETTDINSQYVLNLVTTANVDLAFSLNNFSIIKPSLLNIPKNGFINFHNGPLPQYGGVNVCSWAIINGEKDYGITWHFMEESIDTGDIIAQAFFPITENETARSLTMKCINHGISLFRETFPKIIDNTATQQSQSTHNRSYFGLKDIPNNGHISLNWSFSQIDRFIRGLNFYPFPNTFIYPYLSYNNIKCYVLEIDNLPNEHHQQTKIGEIISIDEKGIHLVSSECILILVSVLNDREQLITTNEFIQQYKLKIGEIFH